MSKIGSGHLAAFGRQGLNELRNALYPDSNVAQRSSEYGLYGTQTPGEVADARRGDGRDLEDEKGPTSVLDRRMEQAKAREEPSPQKDSIEMDR